MIGADKVHLSADGAGRRPAKSIQALSYKCIRAHWPPSSYFHIGGEAFMPPGCFKSGGKKICYPSHKTAFVCLPGPSKPLTRLGSTQWQQSLSSLPLSPSLPPPLFFPSHFVLAHLPVQCRHSVVCLHLLS